MHYRFDIKMVTRTLLIGIAMCISTLASATSGLWMMLGDGNKLESGSKPDRVMRYGTPTK